MKPSTSTVFPSLHSYRSFLLKVATGAAACTLAILLLASKSNPAADHFDEALARVKQLLTAYTNTAPRTFVTSLKIIKAAGVPSEWAGRTFDVALQAPDRLRISGTFKDRAVLAARDGEEIWIYTPTQKFGVSGKTNVCLFSNSPSGERKAVPLPPIALPLPQEKIAMLPLLMQFQSLPDESVGLTPCHVIKATFPPKAHDLIAGLPHGTLELWLRQADAFPMRLGYAEGQMDLQVELVDPRWETAWTDRQWKLPAREVDHIETVARAHLQKFLQVLPATLGEKAAPLGVLTGERRVVAREGKGRLEMIEGTRVLFVQGTPEEMGAQHGILLKKSVRSVVEQVLYGVGVGSSFSNGRWFFGEIESAEKRLLPFMNPRYLREMNALADAAGVMRTELRLANFFPELFHCSGFALTGGATQDGHIYHGRILDYMKGIGLEPNAVVMVMKPNQGHAWVNVSYAGFVGSVTAMNDQHISIGEMGGHGEGEWDGKPMAQLVREVMEQADSLDEAVAVMRNSPRTCEYYYVIADGKTKEAVGVKATPHSFEVLHPGESHPEIRTPVKDAVLFSGGDRLVELTKRVVAGWGSFDSKSARDLMTRPVCMKSNIHSVLFRPDTLDFWVANADGVNVASHARYTHYNLAALLQPETP